MRIHKRPITGTLFLTMLVCGSAVQARASDLVVTDPISRATPAGAPTGVGYMTITNAGDADDRLVSAASPAVDHVEIHEMSVTNGVMTMRPVQGGLSIPAHGSVVLRPGSFHLMLIQPNAPFKAGTRSRSRSPSSTQDRRRSFSPSRPWARSCRP